jgi:hypothetical protein
MVMAWTKVIVVHGSHKYVCDDLTFFNAKDEKVFIKMTFE